MKICIVGAGASGLCAIRHSVAFNIDVTAFEQNDKVGGTWIYTDDIGKDKYGNEIHSSMYESLHTNLPKEIMKFPDFPFPSQPKSYLPARDVNDYLNSYADHFGLHRFIKFSHHVLRIRPILNGKWEVIVKNLLSTAGYETLLFDAIFVCNGHFTTPFYPNLKGFEIYSGKQSHSHEYRKAEKFTHKTVLVIGGGPSGVDISQDIVKCAKKVFWSHHLTSQKIFGIENFIQKPDVSQLTENGAEFVDGSIEEIDEIVYCTGYKFTFPFLSVDCGITTDENYVRPLYKHCININYPTMAFIGLHSQVCPFQLFDLQVRFFLTFLTSQKLFLSKDEMIKDTEFDMSERWKRGLSKKKAHSLGKIYQEKYFADLASTAQIDPIKPVILKIYNESHQHKSQDFHSYRQYNFIILDDENFITEKVIL